MLRESIGHEKKEEGLKWQRVCKYMETGYFCVKKINKVQVLETLECPWPYKALNHVLVLRKKTTVNHGAFIKLNIFLKRKKPRRNQKYYMN